MSGSDGERLSVAQVDVIEGRELEFQEWVDRFAALFASKGYGRTVVVRDEASPRRFYQLRHWTDAAAAARCHADTGAQALTARLHQIGRVTHVVNGVRREAAAPAPLDDQRAHVEPDRRSGFDRRGEHVVRAEGERRAGGDRRVGLQQLRQRSRPTDLIGAARRAREHADAAFSGFKVGAALETGDGDVITGCNIENATFGLTMCAERVAMFKALSEGHRLFRRIAIVADTDQPTPPCGACRQILWEFGGNLEIRLANLTHTTGTHRLEDLLPLPFDARLLNGPPPEHLR